MRIYTDHDIEGWMHTGVLKTFIGSSKSKSFIGFRYYLDVDNIAKLKSMPKEGNQITKYIIDTLSPLKQVRF